MKINKLLLNRNASAMVDLAQILIHCNLNEKIPTTSELVAETKHSRGTIQNSLKSLVNENIVELEAHGHLGTFLVKKDMKQLISLAGITTIVGVMPLPYSKRYEGLATGLIKSSENKFQVPATMAFMRGANQRIEMLKARRYDYAILSKAAFIEYCKGNYDLILVKEFGYHSYLSSHVLIFNNNEEVEIKDGMIIGYDSDSIDQEVLTRNLCENMDVKLRKIDYNKVIELVLTKEIDAAIWNKDEIIDKRIQINYQELSFENNDYNQAVLVVNKDDDIIQYLLAEILDSKQVIKIQNKVLNNQLIPSY